MSGSLGRSKNKGKHIQYFPSLQLFSAQELPEPDMVSMYLVTLSGFLFHELSLNPCKLLSTTPFGKKVPRPGAWRAISLCWFLG